MPAARQKSHRPPDVHLGTVIRLRLPRNPRHPGRVLIVVEQQIVDFSHQMASEWTDANFIFLDSICRFLHLVLEVRLVVLEVLGDPRTTSCPSPSETPLLSFRQKGRLHPLCVQCDAPLPALLLELTLSRCIQPFNAVFRFVWYTWSRPTKSKGTQVVSLQYSTMPCVAHHMEGTIAYVQAALFFLQLYSNASMRADQAKAT